MKSDSFIITKEFIAKKGKGLADLAYMYYGDKQSGYVVSQQNAEKFLRKLFEELKQNLKINLTIEKKNEPS